ncbi:MAG: insulinase family protein [Chloroflexi bacterium]|nr:insulinase family protein [Chloroflexota bacterium]
MSWSAGVLRDVLPNGLTILVQHMPATPAVAIVTRVQAGFFDEPDPLVGISHVVEHMFFKGTATRGVGEIARETREAGGYLNAATSYDYTTFYTVLPVRGLEQGLAIQADALQHPLFDADELRREIGVILQEARRKLDTPSVVVHETLHQLLFDRHRIRRWRIGTEETLGRLTREEVLAYYRQRYVPSRTVLAIAGGMDAERAMALACRHYAAWPAAEPVVDRSPEEPPRRERRARTLRGDVRQADLMVGWRGVPALHDDAVPLDVAAAVLSAGRSSWLYRGLRETGLASAVGAWNYTPLEVGVFYIGISLDPDRMEEALRGAWAAVARLRADGPEGDTLA